MSKKKNKPCITKDEIRKVLEETIKNCFAYPEWWHFCDQAPGLFYWEHEDNKGKICARLKQDNDVWEICSIIDTLDVVWMLIHSNTGSVSWEGDDIRSTLRPYMYEAFVKLSELIKDESDLDVILGTPGRFIAVSSERKLISKEELIKFINENMSDCLGEFYPDKNNTKVYEWALKDGNILKIALIDSAEREHWMIAFGRNVVRTYIELYNDHVIWMMHDDDRMLKLFNDLENAFNLKTFTAADMYHAISEIPQEVVKTETNETSERKLISAKELCDFLKNNIVREFMHGELADAPYAPPSTTYEWYKNDSTYHFGYRGSEDIGPRHWEIFTSVNENNDDNVNIKIYKDHIVLLRESSDFNAVSFGRMFKLFNDLAKEFDLEKFDDTEMIDFESETPQEVVKAETNESKITEGEKEMENKDNYIKMDGEKDSFEGGAIRYTKKGKGRYDLIPSRQIHDILNYAKMNWDNIIGKDDEHCSIHNVLMSAYPDTDDLSYVNYIEIIINIIRYCYIVAASNRVFDAFMIGFVKMLKDLAIHYEMGAEKYGVDNWKNGIPETKGERGGSFRDSGLRHLQQLLDGQTDEPHQIAAIWNFIGAMYGIRNLIDTISGKKHRDTCENCDEPKNSDCSEICNCLKDLLRNTFEDDDQDINHLIEDMMSDTVIDLSHPDPDMNFQCFLMGNIHTNNFCVAFNPNDKKDWHIFNKNKVSVTVFREHCTHLESDHFEITGVDIHGVQCKLNIDRSSITNLDSEFNVKVELSTALEVKQAPQEVVLYKFDFRSTPKKIPKDLWDRFYYNFLSNAVEVRPV